MKNKEYDVKNLKMVSVENIKVNSWNPKEKDTKQYKQVVKSLELYGFKQPILVRETDKPDFYEVVDGEQRFTGAKELGYAVVPVYNLGKITDEEAKAATIWMEVQVPFSEVDLSHLVVELADLNIELPYLENEIADFRAMANFSFDKFNDNDADEDFDGLKTLLIKMVPDQYQVIMDTIKHVMNETESNEARALELIVADYRATNGL